jgi:hypothetical protein
MDYLANLRSFSGICLRGERGKTKPSLNVVFLLPETWNFSNNKKHYGSGTEKADYFLFVDDRDASPPSLFLRAPPPPFHDNDHDSPPANYTGTLCQSFSSYSRPPHAHIQPVVCVIYIYLKLNNRQSTKIILRNGN